VSRTQEQVIKDWYEKKKEARIPSMIAELDGIRTSNNGVFVARRMDDGFVMINTDVLSISYRGGAIFRSAMNVMGNRAVPISFHAMDQSGIPKDDFRLIYKTGGEWYRSAPQLILGVAKTDRTLLFLRDRAWVGLVEIATRYRDPLAAIEALIPKAVQDSRSDKYESIGLTPKNKTDIFRSGEYYFIPRSLDIRKDVIEKWKNIDDKDKRPHKVRDKIVIEGTTFIRGTIRHGTRRMVSCRFLEGASGCAKRVVEPWYEVAKSTQINSWKGIFFWG